MASRGHNIVCVHEERPPTRKIVRQHEVFARPGERERDGDEGRGERLGKKARVERKRGGGDRER